MVVIKELQTTESGSGFNFLIFASSGSNRSKKNKTNVCLSQTHTGREDVCGPRLAVGKRPASLLPTSSFPVCSHFLSCLSLPSATCRLPESRAQSPETSPGKSLYVLRPGEICLFTKMTYKNVQ